ncbi:MAG: PEGA domain-containing protein [Bacteroidales bacterium]|nr:PEGA domain-containing protein [Bacteroidales bacterium]
MGKIKKLFITIILLLSAALVSNAQELGVVSFEKLPNDMAARVNNVRDMNGDLCALLKIETSATGFHFQGFVEKTEQQVGEIYVYVTPGIRFLTIKHQQLGVLRNYEFPQAIESGCVYAMKLVHGKVETKVTPGITHNYLIIRTKVPTSKIYINGEYVGKGECNKYLPIAQEHTYKVEAPLYHTATGTVRLKADAKTDLNVDLKPAYGYLQISTTPEQGATIEINGQEYSSLTPFTTTPMASGKYTIQAFRQMYKTATVEAVVEDGKTTKVDIPLLPNYGELSIKTAHNDDEIYVDNTLVGKGSYSKRMDAGVHRIEVKKDKHQTYTTTVDLSAGQTIAKNIEALKPIVGSLNINSTPMDANITIDGKNYGTTPNVIPDMLIGRHDIVLSKQGYSDLHQTVNVEEGKMVEYTFELQMGNMVSIATDAEGDALYVDGQYIGTSPMETRLSFGSHTVEAERGGKRVSRNIDVAAGAKQSVSLAFEQKINGHEFVDLGLSVKWATCNVGASQPHGYGNYYAWGETKTKRKYTEKNSRTYGKNMSDISGNSNYDVARANWGGSWRMPTKREMKELVNKCTWTWTSQSGVTGHKVTGPNGNSIFLPAAGYCDGSSRDDVGEYGFYWSSTPYEGGTGSAYYLYLLSGSRLVNWSIRYYGFTVRPVSE